jgi:hypothetical protein
MDSRDLGYLVIRTCVFSRFLPTLTKDLSVLKCYRLWARQLTIPAELK